LGFPNQKNKSSIILVVTLSSLVEGVDPTDTVDGQNPAPPGMYKTLVNNGINCLSTGAGFWPSTVALNHFCISGYGVWALLPQVFYGGSEF